MIKKVNNKKKGQSITEYSVLASIVILAFLVMQIYMKRSVQGKLKASSDEIGQQFSFVSSTGGFVSAITSQSARLEETNTQALRGEAVWARSGISAAATIPTGAVLTQYAGAEVTKSRESFSASEYDKSLFADD